MTKRCDSTRSVKRSNVEAQFFIVSLGTNILPVSTHDELSGNIFFSHSGVTESLDMLVMVLWNMSADPWNNAKERFFIWRFPGRLKYLSLQPDRMCKSFCLEKYPEEVKLFDGKQPWNSSGDMLCRCLHRKRISFTELLANLVVSKKIKGLLFVHSKVLGI